MDQIPAEEGSFFFVFFNEHIDRIPGDEVFLFFIFILRSMLFSVVRSPLGSLSFSAIVSRPPGSCFRWKSERWHCRASRTTGWRRRWSLTPRSMGRRWSDFYFHVRRYTRYTPRVIRTGRWVDCHISSPLPLQMLPGKYVKRNVEQGKDRALSRVLGPSCCRLNFSSLV